MNNEGNVNIAEMEIDRGNLYREETFTDLKIGSLQKLIPVKPDGSPDDQRKPIFSGRTQIMSQMGPLPLQATIEAHNLDEACQKFPEAIQRALENMVDEIEKKQREQASQIVVPGKPPGNDPLIMA